MVKRTFMHWTNFWTQCDIWWPIYVLNYAFISTPYRSIRPTCWNYSVDLFFNCYHIGGNGKPDLYFPYLCYRANCQNCRRFYKWRWVFDILFFKFLVENLHCFLRNQTKLHKIIEQKDYYVLKPCWSMLSNVLKRVNFQKW